jgi:hypothetical protein
VLDGRLNEFMEAYLRWKINAPNQMSA